MELIEIAPDSSDLGSTCPIPLVFICFFIKVRLPQSFEVEEIFCFACCKQDWFRDMDRAARREKVKVRVLVRVRVLVMIGSE